jgi:hypothetical protein
MGLTSSKCRASEKRVLGTRLNITAVPTRGIESNPIEPGTQKEHKNNNNTYTTVTTNIAPACWTYFGLWLARLFIVFVLFLLATLVSAPA